MTPDQRYQRLQELFEEAIAIDPTEREEFLASVRDAALRAEVQSLLAHETPAAAELDVSPWSRVRGLEEGDPKQIGPYTILEVLGEGGFGVVYLAERRAPMVQRVALKLIKPGMDSRGVVRRFDQERQVLAVMDHPNVARVFDAGVTSPEQGSRPYFVMELVQGEAITKYCDAQRLTVRQRLELFLPVCEAVQHAHMKGIIHRDLKPGNILVTEVEGAAVPKVIDFGVAKAVAQAETAQTVFTEAGQIIGTPEYMSPEQAQSGGADVDTRTDVYSLGVVLYELLTGSLPFAGEGLASKGLAEIQRIIREVDPPRPSTRLTGLMTGAERESGTAIAAARQTRLAELSRELRRELEWIPLKAMRKDRGERYRSAAELADDVRNYLAGNALIAGPESAAYRARKFVRRRRGLVIAAAAVAASLLVGIVVSAVFAVGQARARLGEEAQHKRAEAINSFLTEMLTAADPKKTRGEKVTVREALDAAAKRIDDGELRGQPLVEAELRATIGRTYHSLALYGPAAVHLRSAAAIQARELGEAHVETLRTRTRLAQALFLLSDYAGTVAVAEPTLPALRRVLGPDDPETLLAMRALGMVLGEVGRYPEAESLLIASIEAHGRVFGADDPRTADAMNDLGETYAYHTRADKAEPLHRQACEIHARALGEDHVRTLNSIQHLAAALFNMGRVSEAALLFRTAYEGQLRILGPEAMGTLSSMSGLGLVAAHLGRYEEAIGLQGECLAILLRVYGRLNATTIAEQTRAARTLDQLDWHAEAEQLLQDALSASLERFGPAHYDTTARVLGDLARVLVARGKYAEAEDVARQALAVLYPMRPPPFGQVRQAAGALRTALRRQGRTEEALRVGREMLDYLVALTNESDARPGVLNRTAQALLTIEEPELRDPQLAHQLATRAVERSGGTDPDLLDTLALACRRLGRDAEAEDASQRALAILYRMSPRARGSQVLETAGSLRAALRRQGKADEALRVGREMLEFLVVAADEPDAPGGGLNNAAWQLLTIEEPELRDPRRAHDLATRAVERFGRRDANLLDTLALASFRLGQTAEAVEIQKEALSLLPPGAEGRGEFEDRLREFQAASDNGGR